MEPSRRADPAAFVARHQDGVLRWLRALGCEADRAEEHCQDALLAALHHGIDERPPATTRSWLRTTARNLYWMQLRHERRSPACRALAEVEEAWLAVRGDDDGGEGALAVLRDCLEAASPRDRDVLDRRYCRNESRAAMASALGVGEAGVKQALRRARARLQQCMEGKLGAREEAAR